MEHTAQLPKKLLSLLLSLLMIFSACYAGVNGVYTVYAAAGDSKYTHAEVIESINAALADGKSYSSSGNAFTLTGDDGKTLAAAEAIFDYAVKTYREGRKVDAKCNSGDTLLAAFLNEFKSEFSNQTTGTALATAILNPTGTTVYGYENLKQNSDIQIQYESNTGYWRTVNKKGNVGDDYTASTADNQYNSSVNRSVINKTVNITVDVDAYLQSFDTIDEIPSSFLTGVSYSYSHACNKYSYISYANEWEKSASWGRKTYYAQTNITTQIWNYMSAKPVRVVTKNTTAKKYLKSVLKFFNEGVLAYTQEDLLGMPLSTLEYLDKQALDFYKMMNDNFNDATLAHFDVPKSEISAFIERLAFAHKVVAAKSAIDTMDAYIGSEYNVNSYSQMSSLYNKVNHAYGVANGMAPEVKSFILDSYPEVAKKYNSINFTEAKAYINTLYEIMTEQRLEEMVNSMMAKYNQYYTLLDRENVNVPSDPEVSSLLSSKNSWNRLLGTYTSKAYYRTYYTTEIEAKWLDFAAKIDAVAEVRGLKAEYQTYYDYFYPIIYTAEINLKDSDFLMTLYDEMDTQLGNLTAKYNDIIAKYNKTIADNIFTLNYEGQNILLQDLVTSSSSAGKAEIKNVLLARTEEMIDDVQAYAGVTTVNFDNFAEIKSTISHFDYDLYDYVTKKGWLSSDYVSKYGMVQTLLDRYHVFSKAGDGGKSFFDENFTYALYDDVYAIRYAGDQKVDTGEVDENGDAIMNQLGYPNDIARNGAEDNYYVTETTMTDTIAKLDGFITSRDFGALLDFYNEEEDAYVGLKEYLNMMLEEMLYNDEMVNTLVGAIFPMLCELIANELVGAIGGLDGAWVDDNGIPWLDLNSLAGISGNLALYLDTARAASHDGGDQKDFPTVFKELGLYIYPYTFAQSLSISNPSFYGPDSEIYKALTAAGRDWSNLVMEDNPETLDVDETKVLEFVWGVYDQDSFVDTLACILDAIIPLLQAVFSSKAFSEEVSNAAIAYSPSLLSVDSVFIRGGLRLDIPALNAYNSIIVPLFKVLGVTTIPTLSSDCSGDDVSQAVFGTLLKRVDEILDAPLSTILEILPDLVYFLSMDSIQEMIDSLTIPLTLTIHEVEVIDFDGWLGYLLDGLDGMLADKISFDVELVVADLINDAGGLYGLLGFEITNFNEVLQFALGAIGSMGGEEGEAPALDLSGLTLPPIKQQEIIFCSDWVGGAGDPAPLKANKGDLLYWLLDYLVGALEDPAFMDMIMGMLSSSEGTEEGGIGDIVTPLIQKITSAFAGNPRGALAAIMEVLNPVTYDLKDMAWVESQWDYNGIDGLQPVDMIYLNYFNDWNEEKANYLVDNFDSLLTTILEMVEMDLGDAETLGAFLQSKINALFTNANITKLVELLCGFGDSASAVIADVVTNQVGINIASWFKAFGYLFPAETWAEDAEIIKPTDKAYVNNFGIEGIANEDGTISWFFNRMPLVDGDGYTFVNILSRLLGEAQILIEFLFAGEDVSAFAGVLKLIGYETFESTLGMLMEAIGVVGVPSQAQFNADPMGSFTNTLIAVLDWFYALTDAEDFASQLLELIPDLFYYVESNGLSVLLHNLLMPVLVLIDTVRPLFDININQLLSIIVSDFISFGEFNMDTILQYVLHGIYIGSDDPDYVEINIDLNNLRVSDILKIVDQIAGTNLYESNLVEYGVTGFCSGVIDVTTDEGYAYKMTTVSAADAITILVTGLLESLEQPAQDATKTNGEVLFAFLGEMMNSATIAGLYPVLAGILEGIDVTYTEPNWGYMLPEGGDIFTVADPRESITYLAYTTDWTPETADTLYAQLDELIAMIAADFDGNVAAIINSMLEDNVYSDANLNMIVELIVNLFAGFNTSLFDLVDVLIDTDIAAWFAMCVEGTDAETGEPKLVCTKDWGVDEATDKRATFVAALKEVLTPANALLEWLFLGDDYEFFTGADKDANDNYIYNDVITLAGGAGYDRAIVPIFKALGIDLAPAASFATGVDAVEAILNSLFDLIDSLTTAESTIEGVVQLLPNLIYFLNADGVKSAVNNLLAPVNALLDMVGPLLGDGKEISITALLGDALPIDITDITTEAVLDLLTELKVGENDEPLNIQFVAYDEDGNELYDLGEILSTLYVGELSAYTYAEKLTGYTLDITDREGDVLTLVISFALEMFLLNEELFTGLLGEEAAAIIESISGLLKGYAVTYTDPDWAYMYEGDDALAKLAADGFPTVEFTYLAYANDWDEDVAVAAYDALDEILVMIMDSVAKGSTIGQLLHDVITDKLYTDANLNSVVELIVNAIAGFDANLLDLIGAVLDADIATWFTFCEVNADSKYECTKDWGVDAASDAGAKKAAFVAGLKEVLAPANELLAWLFFGDSYTFFNGSDGEAIITLIGGEGYKQGLVPIFEALGCTMKSADAYYDATTKTYNVGNAVADIIDSVLALVDDISANPIEEVFALIPNLLYFINADGLTVSVENLLAPLNGVIANLSDVVGADNVQALLFDLIDFNLNDLGIEAILDLLVNETGIVLNDEMLNVICNIYGLGTAADFVSVNGETAYAVDVSGREQDVLTVILTFALELFTLNEELFAGLFGENGAAIVDGIISLLEGYTVAYTDPDWAYMYEGEDALAKLAAVGFPAVEFTYLAYANEWDEPTAQAIYDALDEILVIVMDSVAKGSTIGQLLHGVISDNLYTDANLTAIVELIVNAIAGFDANLLDLIGVVLDADIATWFTFCEVNADGKYECTKDWGVDTSADKKAAFVAGIKEVLAPANQLLSWLFFADDYAFLNGTNGDMITLKGGEGYKQGLVPIFEALGCTMPAAESFKEGETYNVGNAVAAILDAALALVDTISANPIEEVFALIPNLLYFINADGLTASVENLLAPVNAVLAELSDVVGADNLQTLLADLINFDLSNLGTDAVFALLATKAGFITNAEMVATVKNIYGLGEAASFTSVNGETAYRVDITGREYDVLTVILSFALDAFKLNGTIFSELLGAEQYQAVLNLLAGAIDEFEYVDINWAYMYDGDLAQLENANGEFPERTGSAYTIYTQYMNNWNKETADYLNDVLDTLVQEIVKIAKDEDTSIGKMLDNAITRGLYTNSLLNSLIEAVVGALIAYEDIIVKAGVLLDAQGLATWFDDYCTVDAEGNVTCTKDWGIDSATTNEAKRDAFVEGFVEALQPAYRLLAWLLFEKDFEFLTDYAGADHITITGGAGYDEAFVPLLEALGATMKPASAYTDADGNIDMENVVRDVFTALTDILYAICGDLQNPGEKGAIGTMLDLLPNVIYFINADGVKAVVNNLLAPVNFILNELKAFGVEVDFATLIEGIDITNLDWYAVFDIVEDLVPLYFPDFTQEFLATLYMGKAEAYTSANGETAYRMVYTEEESRRDMITVVISFVGDAFVDARNKDQLVDWMGEDIYKVLLTYLSGNAVSVEVQEFDWLFTEYAGTGTVLSPMLVGSLNGLVYGKYFTPEMGRYMEENLPGFVDTVIELLGIEAEDGETTYADLEDVLDTLIGDTIYTKANLDAIVTALPEVIASLKESLGEELFTMIAEVLNRALGIDLTYWNDYRVADIEDGNREQFVNELIRVLKPTYPILAWLLTGDDLIALFHSADGTGRDMIVVEGAEGYAYGIIPLMEALACENIRTPDEFKIAADSQPENMLRLIIDPILDKVDLILADPVNEIFEVLPAVIYFLNSNGLDTVIKNTANAIFAVLENLEPAIGELDVYKLIGFDPTELNINTLIEQLLIDLEESTGLTFKDMAMDAIVELTVGEVVEFTSKNGETAYTMKYVSAEDRADMTSVILRFVMSFVAVEENARALKIMLKDELSEDGFKFVCALLDNFVDMAKTTDGMDKILYTIYYIFIGAEGVVEGVDGSLDEANDNYKFMQDLFAKSDVEFLNNIAGTLGDFLDANFKDIVDSDGIIPNGFIKFFQKLIELFEKIINWFKGFLN